MATNPSLLIVPYRYKAAKLYSQLPESGAGDFTVTRSTTATRINPSGLLESVASGVPRLDYQGGGCPALLVEPAATNLLLRSEEFDNAYWTKQEITITSNASIAPDGTMSADKAIPTAESTTHQIVSANLVSSSQCSFGVFAKADGYSTIEILDRASAVNGALFNLNTGTVTNVGSGSGRIESYGNGWYRCSVTATTTGVRYYIPSSDGAFLGDGTSGVLLWGAQLETGSVATSYIPTVAATQTRNADAISLTGASGLIGQTEGTLYVDIDLNVFAQAGSPVVGLIALTANPLNLDNVVLLGVERQSGGVNRAYAFVTRSGLTEAALFGTSLTSGRYKLAFSYKQNDFALYVNGSQVATSLSGLLPVGTLSDLFLGSRFTGDSVFLNDRISAAATYSSRLSNAELASLTTL